LHFALVKVDIFVEQAKKFLSQVVDLKTGV
jgi:hypothetical protein